MAKAKKVVAPEVLAPSANGIIKVDPTKAAFFTATEEAVRAEGKAQHQWRDVVAPMAVAVYGGLVSFREAQSEVEQKGIIPGFDDATRELLATKLPDARTKQGKEEGQKEKRKARKAAQDKVSKYFARLCEYAFPAEVEAEKEWAKMEAGEGESDDAGEEGDTGAVDAKTLANKTLPALRKKVGEDEEPSYDPVRAAKLIDELMAVFNAMPAQ